jgi:hypothetical protein
MTSVDPLEQIIEELERAQIPHMLAGSFASTYHGDPRTTHDIDLVIDPDRNALDRLVNQLSTERFYISPEAVDEAWRRRGQFNVVIMDLGWKIDLIIRKDRPFSLEEFRRRQRADIGGVVVYVATAEDTVLSKLEWAAAGESERQLRDVVGILQMQEGELDLGYITHWVEVLGVERLWRKVNGE